MLTGQFFLDWILPEADPEPRIGFSNWWGNRVRGDRKKGRAGKDEISGPVPAQCDPAGSSKLSLTPYLTWRKKTWVLYFNISQTLASLDARRKLSGTLAFHPGQGLKFSKAILRRWSLVGRVQSRAVELVITGVFGDQWLLLLHGLDVW